MKVVLLIGSGVSLAANLKDQEKPHKMPSTREITNTIVREQNPEERYNRVKGLPIGKLRRFIQLIDDEIAAYKANASTIHASNQERNYEEWYSLLMDLWYGIFQSSFKPGLSRLSNHFEKEDLLSPENDLQYYVGRSMQFIKAVVRSMLEEATTYKTNNFNSWDDHWDLFMNLYKNPEIEELSIFSLNHDTLLEQYFEDHSIAHVDGFGLSDFEGHIISHWDRENYQQNQKKVDLFKLHGSINSYWESDENKPYLPPGYWLIRPEESQGYQAPSGNDSRTLLMGIQNKLEQYLRAHYFDLQCLFADRLERSDHFIISGYGFNDLGINRQIISRWFRSLEKEDVIVIGKQDDFQDSFDVSLKRFADRFTFLEAYFEEVSSLQGIGIS